jgi:hypothetical protein
MQTPITITEVEVIFFCRMFFFCLKLSDSIINEDDMQVNPYSRKLDGGFVFRKPEQAITFLNIMYAGA